MKIQGIFGIVVGVVLGVGLVVQGYARTQQNDDPEKDPPQANRPNAPEDESLASINAEFEREVLKLERRRLERLARLAVRQQPDEANRTYEIYFQSAIASGLYREAEPTAERVIKASNVTPQVVLLAFLVNIVAEANRGAYQESLDSILAAIEAKDRDKADAKPATALPLATRLSLIEAYYQSLIQGGQFEVARKALTLIQEHSESDEIKDLVASRQKQLDLLGKPAPGIAGNDVDGKPVSLEDYKGKPVLVVFWASWCLPNAEEIRWFKQVYEAHRDQGFRVLGINLDVLQDGGQDVETVLPNIRRFLIDHNVSWPNLINGQGDRDYAKAFGITEIPANVLIGRDGKVIHLDLTRSNLEQIVSKAVAH